MLDIPARGCLNIHASLLPRWRGAAPIQRAILAGDARDRHLHHAMEAGLDTGPVLLEQRDRRSARATPPAALTERSPQLGAEAIVEALAGLDALEPAPQDAARATYAAKIAKAEARIDWIAAAAQIDRQVRAFNPAPGAEARVGGRAAQDLGGGAGAGCAARPGKSLAATRGELWSRAATGALRLLEVQRPGGRRMPAAEFLRGKRLAPRTPQMRKPLILTGFRCRRHRARCWQVLEISGKLIS